MTKQRELKNIRGNQIFIILLLTLIVVLMMIPYVQAQTIQIASPDITIRDVAVYYPNYTLYGLYNTTSLITLDANYSYVFTLKPQNTNPLSDPNAFMTSAFAYVQTNLIAILIMVFLAAIWLGRR